MRRKLRFGAFGEMTQLILAPLQEVGALCSQAVLFPRVPLEAQETLFSVSLLLWGGMQICKQLQQEKGQDPSGHLCQPRSSPLSM